MTPLMYLKYCCVENVFPLTMDSVLKHYLSVQFKVENSWIQRCKRRRSLAEMIVMAPPSTTHHPSQSPLPFFGEDTKYSLHKIFINKLFSAAVTNYINLFSLFIYFPVNWKLLEYLWDEINHNLFHQINRIRKINGFSFISKVFRNELRLPRKA